MKPRLLILSLFFLLPVQVFARSDFIRFQDEVIVAEKVEGEALIFAGTVEIKEPVGGDALIIGNKVVIKAPIAEDVRIVANDLTIDASVSGNASILAVSVVLGEKSAIGGNLYIVSPAVDVKGIVDGNLVFKGDAMFLSGGIKGNTDLGEVVEFTVSESARIGGALAYTSREPFDLPPQLVQGEIRYKPVIHEPFWKRIHWFFEAVWLFAALSIGLLLVNLFPRQLKEITIGMAERPLRAFLMGIVFSIITPLASLLLAATLIGIPLGLLIAGLWLFGLYVSSLFVAVIIGKLALVGMAQDKQKMASVSVVWFLIIGLVCARFVFLLPFIGGIAQLFAVWFGFGGIVLWFKNKQANVKVN